MTYPLDYPKQMDHGIHSPVLLESETGQWLTRNVRNLLDVLDRTSTEEMRGSWFEAELLSWMLCNFLGDALPHDEGELVHLLRLRHEGRTAGRNGLAAVRMVGEWRAPPPRAQADASYSDSYERAR